MGDEAQPWWPKKDGHHWPSEDKGVPQQETVEAFIAAFGTKDYVVCGHGNVEHGKEKIALYADPKTRRPKHAARQLPNGRWKSKLGGGIDIEHSSLDELNCDLHGTVVCFLERDVGILSL